MKRCYAIALLSAAALTLMQLPVSGAEPSKATAGIERHDSGRRLRFVDEDGDGLNDLVPDSDGDGIPNGGEGKRAVSDRALEELFHYGTNLPHQQDRDASVSPAGGAGAAQSRGGGR